MSIVPRLNTLFRHTGLALKDTSRTTKPMDLGFVDFLEVVFLALHRARLFTHAHPLIEHPARIATLDEPDCDVCVEEVVSLHAAAEHP